MKQSLIILILCVIVPGTTLSARTRVARRHVAHQPNTDSTCQKSLKVEVLDSVLRIMPPASPTEKKVSEPIATLEAPKAEENAIMGEPELTATELYNFVVEKNPDFTPDIAEAFINVGRKYGIRGDIALCQSIIETGWFKYTGGTAVTPDQHNYCGLGVTKMGLKGCAFPTVEQGVTAQIQHLYAYASTAPLPEGEELLDPRFKLVQRGVAPTWQGLSNRWAANSRYATQIITLFNQAKKHAKK